MTRRKVYDQLHGTGGTLTATQRLVLTAILVGVGIAILGTERKLPAPALRALDAAELVVGVVFLAEYVLRVWSIGEDARFAGLGGRLRYMARPFPVIDVIALVPFLLGTIGAESFVLRALRVVRLLALAKLARYSEAMRIVLAAVVERRFELTFAFMIAALMILLSSAALYLIEGDNQPETFGSIPRAMWWSVVTLTTVGYGDAVPLTPIGKVFAGLTAIAGIGMIAMPTGILAASFSEGFAKARAR